MFNVLKIVMTELGHKYIYLFIYLLLFNRFKNKLSVFFVIIKKTTIYVITHMSTRTRVRLYVFVEYKTDKIPYLEEGSLTLRNISGFLILRN